MYCPECLCEFRDGFTECSDCQAPLKFGQPPELRPDPKQNGRSDLELVTILECANPSQFALVQGILDDAGIPFLVNGRAPGPDPIHGIDARFHLAIQVPSDQANEARGLVASLEE